MYAHRCHLLILLGGHDKHKVTFDRMRVWYALGDYFRSPNDGFMIPRAGQNKPNCTALPKTALN